MAATETAPASAPGELVAFGLLMEQAQQDLAAALERTEAAEAKAAEYENAVNWNTSCTSCAAVLDSCIAETERRVQAEDALAAERERADEAVAELAALEGSTGTLVAAAGAAERDRAERAQATLAVALVILGRVRELAEGWTADDGQGPPTPEMLTEAAHGEAVLNLLAGGHPLNGRHPAGWSGACAPGGMVCTVPDLSRPDGICGNPVESEPCTNHEEPPNA